MRVVRVFCDIVHQVAEKSGINCVVVRGLCCWVVLVLVATLQQHCNTSWFPHQNGWAVGILAVAGAWPLSQQSATLEYLLN
jgi:hypothetical protein